MLISDLEIRSFKTGMIEHMNKYPLPIEIKRLVLVDILDETRKLADATLKEQILALQQEKEKSNSEKSPG